MIRPLLTAGLEYILAYLVFKYGKTHKNIIALVLFFLASYQLGEVLVFLTNGEQFAFKVAYVSTTMLPPLGVLLVSKIINKRIGYLLFQSIALIFVGFIIWTPQVVLQFELGQYCVRIFEYNPILAQFWIYYYQGTLVFTMLAMLIGFLLISKKDVKEKLKWMFIAYMSFDGLAIILAYFNPWFGPSIASLMCALAIFAAIIFARISLPKNLNELTAFWYPH